MAIDVASLKVAELRAELKSRDLVTTGLKAELAARLQEAIDAEGAGGEAEVEPAAAEAPAPAAEVESASASAAAEDDAGEDEDPDVSTMTVAVLKDELKARGLPVSGKKVELQERLQEAVAASHSDSAHVELEVADSVRAEAAPAESAPIEVAPAVEVADVHKRKRDEPEATAADMDVDSDEPISPEPGKGPRPSPPPNDAVVPEAKRAKLDAEPPTSAPPPPPTDIHPSERVFVPPPAPPAPVARAIPEDAQAYVLDPSATIDDVRSGLTDVTRPLTTGKAVEIDLLAGELAIELHVPVSALVAPIAFPSVSPWEGLSSLYVGFASNTGDESNELASKLAGEAVTGPLVVVRYTPATAVGPIERNTRSTNRDDLAASIAFWAAADEAKRAKTVNDRFERMKLGSLVPGASQSDKAAKTEATLRRLLARA